MTARRLSRARARLVLATPILLAPVLVLAACAGARPRKVQASLLDDLRQIVESESTGDRVLAIAYDDLRGTQFALNGQTVLHAASTMKVPVMIELLRRVDREELALEQEIMLENRFASIVDGSPYSLTKADDSDPDLYVRVGSRIQLGELCQRMIDASSNLATNVLVELLGAEAIQQTIESLGTKHTSVLRGVEDQKAYDRGLSNRTCARDLCTLFAAIAEDEAASPESCAKMRAILAGQRHRSMLPAGLPDGTRIAHKTGRITKIHHDAGIIWRGDGSAYVLVVLTKGFEDERASAALGARVAARTWAESARTR